MQVDAPTDDPVQCSAAMTATFVRAGAQHELFVNLNHITKVRDRGLPLHDAV